MHRLIALALALAATAAHARVMRIEAHAGKSPNAHYTVLTGIAYGELNPGDGHNRLITDIQFAPRNAQTKRVQYAATFTLYIPNKPAPDSVLLYEVVNRGASLLPREYANNDFFLLSGWQGDIPFNGLAINGKHGETISVPVARNADGSLITGPAMARWIDLKPGTQTLALGDSITYHTSGTPPLPFTLDQKQAHLFTKQSEAEDGTSTGVKEVPQTDWSWGVCGAQPGGTAICLNKPVDPALMYELHYTAKDPLVLGIGLAAIRDLNAFFRYAKDDGHGFTNPVAPHIHGTVAAGISQSGNLLRTWLNLGFNQSEDNRIVFDGVMPIIAARMVPINVRFGVPGGMGFPFEVGSDGINWWTATPDPVRHLPTGSLLDRCTASHTCPKIMELLGSGEFYSLRASLDFVGTTAVRDIPLPANVRRYYVAGTSHGGGNGKLYLTPNEKQYPSNCMLPSNPNPQNPTRRALLLAMKQWVTTNVEPPPSVYPKLSDHTLAPAEEVIASFPHIGSYPAPTIHVLNPLLFYDLGAQFHYRDLSGVDTKVPPTVMRKLPTVLPTLDADGNERGGIHSVFQQAPLGTYTGWNITTSGFRAGQFCNLQGAYIPFAATEADRAKAQDSRPSLAARYKSHDEYVRRVKKAAASLVQQRFMLQDDADAFVRAAEKSAIWETAAR
ncbi:MAG: hypothetical protein JSS87_02600 [Acidobacteria bacterium]|nr:hypothetical protein [Acidobacteriota bacterium]